MLSNARFASACATSLRRFILRLLMCLLTQHDNRWRHVSFWWDAHRLHAGDMSCLFVCLFVCVCLFIYLFIKN